MTIYDQAFDLKRNQSNKVQRRIVTLVRHAQRASYQLPHADGAAEIHTVVILCDRSDICPETTKKTSGTISKVFNGH